MANRKYYVVWAGRAPGIYDNWDEAKAQVEGYPDARYKGFATQDEATEAFRGKPSDHIGILRAIATHNAEVRRAEPPVTSAIAVDGACSRNPGPMEYRGVNVADGREIFHFGPQEGGTNNIAEYLAIVHALALLDRNGDTRTAVYSDSRTALSWVRNRGHKSQLAPTPRNGRIFELLARADAWLRAHPVHARVLKWDTSLYGEIPADFGRK